MKRPKLADMTPGERVRFRLLQSRRRAQRSLRENNAILDNHGAEISDDFRCSLKDEARFYRSVVIVTKPSAVNAASFNSALATLDYIAGRLHA